MTEIAARRRRRRRKQVAIGLTAGAVVLAAGGSAWAMSGSDAPSYRLATATKADVAQTVDVDGTLAARDTATAAFASGGTVDSVRVAVGDTVTAGQTLATIDPSELAAAVRTARSALATAKQRLADDQQAQLNGTASTASGGTTSGTGTAGGTGGTGVASAVSTRSTVTLTAARTPTAAPTGSTGGSTDSTGAVSTAQRAVVSAQRDLDKAIAAQDSAIADLVGSCAASTETQPTISTVTADAAGTVSGSAGAAAVAVTLRGTDGAVAQTTSANPQRIAAGGTWTFAGLTAGTAYRVESVRTAAVDSAACATAVTAVSSGQREVDTAVTALDKAMDALTSAVAKLGTGSAGTTTPGTGTGSSGTSGGSNAPSRSTTGSGSGSGSGATAPSTGGSNDSSSGTTQSVTAEQIAADAKNVDAKAADLAVATQDVGHATLTSSIGGTVAAVTLAKGDTVSASSTTSTITVVGKGTLSSVVDVGIADIDLVRVGETVAVSVDGRTTPVAARVSYIGTTNSSSSTGSAATYPVTIALDRSDAALYDGMGASLAIDVGGADDVLTVPLSAVHTTGTTSTVRVYRSGSTTTTRVALGLVGDDRAQIRSGLAAGDRVVLAEVSAAVPSSGDSTTTGGGLGGLTGGQGRQGGQGGGAPPAGR